MTNKEIREAMAAGRQEALKTAAKNPYIHGGARITLSKMFNMQSKLQAAMFGYDLPSDSVEDFKYSVLALIGELGEVLEADKRWKNIRNYKYDREGKLDELVDCMAFMLNMILFSGFTVEEFTKAFVTKNNRNFERFYKEKENKQSETGPLHLEGSVV